MGTEIDQDEELTQWQKDKLVDDDIDKLLYVPIEDRSHEHAPFNPYSLDSKVRFFETKFINGIKKLPPAYKELKSASKGSFISEIELGRIVEGEYSLTNFSSLESGQYPVFLQGAKNKYWLKPQGLSFLLWNSTASFWKSIEGGQALIALIVVNKEFILRNCTKCP